MPWKGEPDPYKIWLSEIILQQTRVEQGWAYYEKFIARYPTIIHLAQAPEPEVFKMWEGLGYYSRCKNLIATARHITDNLNGKFPDNYSDILLLKGVGPYTAAAIASFAFHEKRAVVDGNVQRVLARYFGITAPIDSTRGKKLFSTLADSLIDPDHPAVYNQAIMDFGATICRPRNPLCHECPQQTSCEALRHGVIDQLPVKENAPARRTRWLYYFIVIQNGEVYIRKRTADDIWQNLHEFILLEAEDEQPHPPESFLRELFKHQNFSVVHASDIQKQQLTHLNIRGRFYTIRLGHTQPIAGNYMRVAVNNLHEYAFPRYINVYLDQHPIHVR